MTDNISEPLLLWQDSTTHASLLAQAIGHVRANATDPLGDIAALRSEAALKPSARLLLLYAPRDRLCQLMDDGNPPDRALDIWRTEAEAIAEVMRQFRARATLLDAAEARLYPVAVSVMLGLNDETANWAADAQAVDPVLELMAAHTLDSHARALLGLLEASAADLSDGQGPRRADAEAAFKAYRDASAMEEMQSKIETLQQEAQAQHLAVEMMTQQQSAMETELGLLHGRRDQLEARIAQMSQGMDSYQSQIASLQQDVDLRGEKLSLKNAQLNSLAHNVRALEAEIDRVRRSYSMRLTSPLRFVTRVLRGRKHD